MPKPTRTSGRSGSTVTQANCSSCKTAARPTEHPDALDYILRGRAVVSKLATRENYAGAIGFFERALALDPHSVEAQSLLAITLVARVFDGMTDSTATDISRADRLVAEALAAAPRSPLAHHAKGHVLRAQRRYAEAVPEYEIAIASNRNSVTAITHLGQCKFFTGSIEEMIPAQERAIRLSPRDAYLGIWYYRIGLAHLVQSRTDEAILWLEKARSANPALAAVHAYLASAYAKATGNAPPPNSSKPAGWSATIIIRALPA
jgi:adenylate cyclase